MNSKNEQDSGPWYKELWGWIVFTPLIVVILTCTVMVTIAIRTADDVVIDDYYKEGRLINRSFSADQNAIDRGISGALVFNLAARVISFTLEKTVQLEDELTLFLSHPAKTELDRTIQLQKISSTRFIADNVDVEKGRWYIRISPATSETSQLRGADGEEKTQWRLSGEIDLNNTTSIVLR